MIIVEKLEMIINSIKYILTTEGKVYSTFNGKEIKQRLNADGYFCFTSGKKNFRTCVRTHRVIAKAFIPNPEGKPEVNHIDSDRTNNNVKNLEWMTRKENILHSYRSGKNNNRGENNPHSNLTRELVIEMRKLYKNGMTINEMAKKNDKPWNTVSNAVKGITWSHIKEY